MAPRFLWLAAALVTAACARHAPAPPPTFAPIPIDNGAFTRWEAGVPAGWTYGRNRVQAGDLARAHDGAADAVALRVKPAGHGGWHGTQLAQTVPSSRGRLVVRIRPETDYVGDSYPHSVCGIELVDAVDHLRYYVIDSRLDTPHAFHRDGAAVYVFPGHLHRWNTLAIDIAPQPDDAFVSDAHSPMQIQLVAAVHDDEFGAPAPAALFSSVASR